MPTQLPQSGLYVTPTIVLERMLGQGGMGSVWIANHLKFHIKVVVKFMAEEFTSSPEAWTRFEREAALAAQAKSPHVVQIYDHGISSIGVPYIAMELLEGEDLASRMHRLGRISPQLYAGWLWQMCAGLSRAHAKGIVHRDVKPENIFLCDDDGETLVKILDFGIAKSHETTGGFSATRTGVMMGTAYYMSPEQTMGSKKIDQRADVWALGAMSYHALTGVRPFDADSLGALVYAITAGPIAPPSTHNPELSPEIDAWMAKALERNPEARFSSAKGLATAFLAAVSGVDPRSSRMRLGPQHELQERASSSAADAPLLATQIVATTAASPGPVPQPKDTINGWGQTTSSNRRSPRWPLLGALGLVAVGIFAAVYALSSGKDDDSASTVPLYPTQDYPSQAAVSDLAQHAADPPSRQPSTVGQSPDEAQLPKAAPAQSPKATRPPAIPSPKATRPTATPSSKAAQSSTSEAAHPRVAPSPATPTPQPAPAPKPASTLGGRL